MGLKKYTKETYRTLTSPEAKKSYKKAISVTSKGLSATSRYFKKTESELDRVLGFPTKKTKYRKRRK